MKALITAVVVALVFALFFTAFLVAPAIVILVAYFGMTWHHKRLSRKAKARAAARPAVEAAPKAEGAPA